MRATEKAHTNITLIKYWRKRNDHLNFHIYNSISITLDVFYTESIVNFKENHTEDIFILNDEIISGVHYNQATTYLNLFRNYVQRPTLYAEVNSINKVPTAAGFASRSEERRVGKEWRFLWWTERTRRNKWEKEER